MLNMTTSGDQPAIILRSHDKASLAAYRETAPERVRNLLDFQGLEGKAGQYAPLVDEQGRLVEVLFGREVDLDDPRADLLLFATLAAKLPKGRVYELAREELAHFDGEQAALGWGLAGYKFERYLKNKRENFATLRLPEGVDEGRVRRQLDAVFLGRDLINTPASDLGPRDLADQARRIAEAEGADIEITEGEELLKAGFPAIHTVGRGSARPPVLIDLRWGDPSHPKLTLVGKGIVFDTGGLNLKPASGMLAMKKDMGGAAVTLALAQLVMQSQLPVRLRLLIPAAENSPGQNAYRPGDVVHTRKGLTVEIGNTDAEGRVVLCDALAEAVSEDPDLILDMATLTGAARIALGQDVPGFWTPDDQIGQAFYEASMKAADPCWRMPLWQPYRSMLKSPIADMNNMGNSPLGGSITAALYLYEFVKPFNNWIHMDVFGWRNDAQPGTPKGGEATALRAVYRFLEDRYAGA